MFSLDRQCRVCSVPSHRGRHHRRLHRGVERAKRSKHDCFWGEFVTTLVAGLRSFCFVEEGGSLGHDRRGRCWLSSRQMESFHPSQVASNYQLQTKLMITLIDSKPFHPASWSSLPATFSSSPSLSLLLAFAPSRQKSGKFSCLYLHTVWVWPHLFSRVLLT